MFLEMRALSGVWLALNRRVYLGFLKTKNYSIEQKIYGVINASAWFLVFFLLFLQIQDILSSSYFTRTTLAEETAYTYTSAYNYLKYGFFNSGLLQDFSSSVDSLDHPYVYNHMPAGPDLLMAVLLYISNGSVIFTKIFYALVACFGFHYYLQFANIFLKKISFPVAGIAILYAGPHIIIGILERQIYSLFPLLMFLPFVYLNNFYINKKKFNFYLSVFVVFLSSIYIEYSMLSGIIFCWTFLFLVQIIPIKLKHFIIILGAFSAGIFLHLVQNMLYFGPEFFFKELYITLSNRITGYPLQDEIRYFYESAGIVHHGSKPVDMNILSIQIFNNLAGSKLIWIGMIASLLWFYISSATSQVVNRIASIYFKISAWLLGTLICPIFLFPAFAQEVNMIGVGLNKLLIGVVAAVVIGIIFKHIIYNSLCSIDFTFLKNKLLYDLSFKKTWLYFSRLIAIVALTVLFIKFSGQIAKAAVQNTATLATSFKKTNWAAPLNDMQMFANKLFMTNINVTTPGLLTKSVGFGVCGPDSLSKSGSIDLNECKVCFTKRRNYWSNQDPKYFFYFKDARLFPGFADCLPTNTLGGQERGTADCMQVLFDKLNTNYKLIYKNSLMTVFDLQERASR